jgi:peptidoglycan/xylan/chitin deacetylase (PgdA/CDA1 family)
MGLKSLGVFDAARALTSDRIRILCYHGISIGDQAQFHPGLFMRLEVFAGRLKLLQDDRWSVISLNQAISDISSGIIKNAPVVITFDDGWKSIGDLAAPLLAQFGMRSTSYITSYYVEKRSDLFNVALYYLFWKTNCTQLIIQRGHAAIDGTYDLTKGHARLIARLIEFSSTHLTWQERQEFLEQLTVSLGIDPTLAFSDDRFKISPLDDLRLLPKLGMDLQLHTHRHRLPNSSFDAMAKEITDNQEVLNAVTDASLVHFCYPSGVYSKEHPDWLKACGMESATTVDPGLNGVGSNPFLLKRILDRDNWCDIEFEAEISGLRELPHALWRRLKETRIMKRLSQY